MRVRWLQRLSLSLGGVLIVALIGLALWGGWQIASPGRRPLQAYHREILEAPAAHGMTVEGFVTSDGTPAILCRPAGVLGERGQRIREQLEQRNWTSRLPGAHVENGMTLVLLHGRRGRKEDNLPIAERFCAAGFRCLLVDLPAHGDHPTGIAAFGVWEAGVPKAVLDDAAGRFGFPNRPAGLWGISMGGSVAVYAAARDPAAWQGLVVVASFDALQPVIERQCEAWVGSWLGPMVFKGVSTVYQWRSGVALGEIRPVDHLPRVSAGTLIVHGDDDPLIPPSAGDALVEAVGGRNRQQIHVADGTHGNVLITPQPLYVEMVIWFLQQRGTTAPAPPS